jgi:hypothetical protein
MNEPVNRHTAEGKKLIFFPKTEDECRELQERLFELGFTWSNGNARAANVTQCVETGLVLMNNYIYFRSPGDAEKYTACSIDRVLPGYLPPDQKMMLEVFNRLSDKIDALSEKVDRLYEEIRPDVGTTKPGLRKPPASGG